MAQYTNLNAPPERSLREIIDEKIQTRGSATGAAGVKDLGLSGDVVWPRPDGTPVSVRDVDLELADARQRLEDAEGALTDSQARLEGAEGQLVEAREALDALDSRVDVTALQVSRGPLPPTGAPVGAQWLTPEGYLYVRVDCDEEAA